VQDVEGFVMVYFRALCQPSAPIGRRNTEYAHLEYSILEAKIESIYIQKTDALYW